MGLFNFFKKTKFKVGNVVRITSMCGVGTLQLVGTTATIHRIKNNKYYLNDFEVVQFYDLSNISFDDSELEFSTKEDIRDYKLKQLLG